jgi:outer membrane protein assembly factor BamB
VSPLRVLACALALGLLPASSAAAVDVPPGTLQVDGPVNAITRIGDRLLVEGGFRSIGTFLGYGTAIDPTSGAVAPGFPLVYGQVSEAIGDGAGGLYLGGAFTSVGGHETRGVAHVRADGTVDPAFTADVEPLVTSLAVAGGRLYAGNYRQRGPGSGLVLALDLRTGQRLGAALRAPADVTELLAVGSRVYVGAKDVFAIDAATGVRDPGFACERCVDEERITALLAVGDRLYVGGSTLGVFAVDARTGARDSRFAPSPNRVASQAFERGPLVFLLDGGRLIVGGHGMALGGGSSNLVALDPATGAADRAFGAGQNLPIHDLLVQGGALLAGGSAANGERGGLHRIDRATGAVTADLAPDFDGPIDALAQRPDGRVFAGGRFARTGVVRTQSVAMLDARSGRIAPGFAFRTYSPQDWTVAGSLLVGVDSDFATPTTHNGLRAYSLASGRRVWSFRPSGIATRRLSRPIPIAGAPGVVYAARNLRSGRVPWGPVDVFAISTRSGARTATWRLPYPGYVRDLLVEGDRLYVGGSFRRFRPGGEPAHLATLALDRRTGRVLAGFDAHTHGPIETISRAGGRLVLTGLFDRAGIAGRRNLAAVDPLTGDVDTAFAPRLGRLAINQLAFDDAVALPPAAVLLQRGYSNPLVLDLGTGRRRALPAIGLDGAQSIAAVGRRRYAAFDLRPPMFDYSRSSYLAFVP